MASARGEHTISRARHADAAARLSRRRRWGRTELSSTGTRILRSGAMVAGRGTRARVAEDDCFCLSAGTCPDRESRKSSATVYQVPEPTVWRSGV
eukprot:95320-Chlamydomonas_euryale.AAC.4